MKRIYRYFGLTVESDFALDRLPAAAGTPDVRIVAGKVAPRQAQKSLVGEHVHVSHTTDYAAWDFLGRVLVRDGRQITVDVDTQLRDPRLVQDTLIGPAFALLLNQRNLFVLHMSAVMWNGLAIGFVGDSGAGKSTLASYLGLRGFKLIGDDLLPIDMSQKTPAVIPSLGETRLWPDSALGLGLTVDDLPYQNGQIDKRLLRMSRAACRPIAVSRIYCLERGPNIAIEPILGRRRLLHIARHSYLPWLFDARPRSHFIQSTAIADATPVHLLTYPRQFSAMPALHDTLTTHLAAV